MFEFLFNIIRSSHHTHEVWQFIDVRTDDFESSREWMKECKQLSSHIVHHDQDQLIHDDSARIEDESTWCWCKQTQQLSQSKQWFKLRSRWIHWERMFDICCQNDKLIHDARQSWSHAINDEFKNVQIENSFQYHQRRSHWLSEWLNIVQKYSVQHEWLSRHDSRVDERKLTHVDERFDVWRCWVKLTQNCMIIIKKQFNWKNVRLKFHSECMQSDDWCTTLIVWSNWTEWEC